MTPTLSGDINLGDWSPTIALLDQLPTALCLLDPLTRRISYANSAMAEFWRLSAADLIGLDAASLFDAPDSVHDDLTLLFSTSTLPPNRICNIASQLPCEVAAWSQQCRIDYFKVASETPLNGLSLTPCPIATSNTESDVNRTKFLFLASINHELRTPINAILGLCYTLGLTALNADQQAQLRTLRAAADSLLELINHVIEISHSEFESNKTNVTTFDLGVTLREINQLFRRLIRQRGLTFTIDVDWMICPRQIQGDPVKLKRILQNLISNALKFTNHGGISLRVRPNSRPDANNIILEFQVADTGIGIEASDQAQIFKPFSQVNTALDRQHEGSGLGLWIVQKLLQSINGSIECTSTPGHGTTMTFFIPYLVPSQSSTTQAWLPSIYETPMSVLLCSSNIKLAATLRDSCSVLGWSLDVRRGGAALVAYLKHATDTSPLDMILIDLSQHSSELTRHLREFQKLTTNISFKRTLITLYDPYSTDSKVEPWVQEVRSILSDAKLLSTHVSPANLFNFMLRHHIEYHQTPGEILQRTRVEPGQILWLKGLSILVVDDNQINLDICARLLRALGAHVVLCESGLQAINALKTQPESGRFNLVLMDIQMPGMNGYEATREIKRLPGAAYLPVVALSAGTFQANIDESKSCGMVDFIAKPVKPATFVRVIYKNINLQESMPDGVVSTDIHAPLPEDIKPENSMRSTEYHSDNSQSWSLIPEVDEDLAREICLNDHDFYLRLLRVFRKDAQEITSSLDNSIAIGDNETTQKLLHKLKGMTANLGAKDFSDFTSAQEKATKEGLVIASDYIAQLKHLLFNIDAALTQQPSTNPGQQPDTALSSQAPTSTSKTPSLTNNNRLDQLSLMLAEQNLSSIRLWETMREALAKEMDMTDWQAMDDAVCSLQFEEASKILQSFRARFYQSDTDR